MTTSMTRKHFQAIADAVQAARNETQYEQIEFAEMMDNGVILAARHIAAALRQFNPAFDTNKFLRACGVDA